MRSRQTIPRVGAGGAEGSRRDHGAVDGKVSGGACQISVAAPVGAGGVSIHHGTTGARQIVLLFESVGPLGRAMKTGSLLQGRTMRIVEAFIAFAQRANPTGFASGREIFRLTFV